MFESELSTNNLNSLFSMILNSTDRFYSVTKKVICRSIFYLMNNIFFLAVHQDEHVSSLSATVPHCPPHP
jgi:hypothetical protein